MRPNWLIVPSTGQIRSASASGRAPSLQRAGEEVVEAGVSGDVAARPPRSCRRRTCARTSAPAGSSSRRARATRRGRRTRSGRAWATRIAAGPCGDRTRAASGRGGGANSIDARSRRGCAATLAILRPCDRLPASSLEVARALIGASVLRRRRRRDGSSRPRPTTRAIRRRTASPAIRRATRRCSARRAAPTSTARTASTGASTSSACRRGHGAGVLIRALEPTARHRADARAARRRRPAPALLRARAGSARRSA